MKEFPKYLIRPDDGERFVLGADDLYRNEILLKQFPDNLHHSWTYETLKSAGFIEDNYMKEFLENLKNELNSQHNRHTCDPIFLVEEKVRMYGYDYEYSDSYIWINNESGECEEADPEKSAQLDEDDEWQLKEEDLGWRKVYYVDRWETVQMFFTEKAANEFMENNRHRHGEMRTYVDSLYRNEEMKYLRDLLASGEILNNLKN